MESVINTPSPRTQGPFITFRLGDELFGLPVSQVREVLEVSRLTRVPTAPSYVRGVVNVRGRAIPVVDLRLKFGLSSAPDTVNTRFLVMELPLAGAKTVVGGVADSVDEVIDLEPGEVVPPPSIGMRWRSEYVHGMGRHGDGFIILLDMGHVFTSADTAVLPLGGDRASGVGSAVGRG